MIPVNFPVSREVAANFWSPWSSSTRTAVASECGYESGTRKRINAAIRGDRILESVPRR
jgi:hypothetical protein